MFQMGKLKGFKMPTSNPTLPECAIFTCGLFEVKGIWDPAAQENFCPYLNQTEESNLGVFPRIRLINKDEFYLSDPFVSQGKRGY